MDQEKNWDKVSMKICIAIWTQSRGERENKFKWQDFVCHSSHLLWINSIIISVTSCCNFHQTAILSARTSISSANIQCKRTLLCNLSNTETMIKNSRFEKLQNEGQELMQSTQNREMLLLEEFFFLLLIFSSGTIRSYFHRPLVPWKIWWNIARTLAGVADHFHFCSWHFLFSVS